MKCRFFLLAVLLVSTGVQSQTAENLYDDSMSKFSIVLQPALLKGSDVSTFYDTGLDGSPSISFNRAFSPHVGFFYNFYQTKNFNFKAGLIVKTFVPTFDIQISNEDLNAGFDYSSTLTDFEMANQLIFSQTVKAEYFLALNQKLSIVLGAGVSLDLRTSGGNDELSVSIYDYNLEEFRTIFTVESVENQITGSLDVSLGVNYKTGFGAFQLEFFNNSQLITYPKSGVFEFDLNNNQTQTGAYTLKGNYNGLALLFTPRKGLLKRKNTIR